MGRAKKSAEVEAQVIARGNVVPMMTETESAETVQYVSDEDAAREDRLVSEIRMITEQTKQVVLFNSIEIGRRLTEAKAMVKRGTWGTWLYKYESTLDNDLIFWSNATADLRHNGEIGEDDLPDELLHALNELWTDGHLVSCYLVELKGRYGIALESIYDRDFAESLGITYGELVKRVEKKANYISREYPEFDTLFGKDTQSWSDGSVNSQLLVIVPWDESKETFESVAKWLDSIVYEI